MRAAIFGVLSASSVAAVAPPAGYVQQGYAAPAPQAYPAAHPAAAAAAAAADAYAKAEESKAHFEQYWKNLEMCEAQYELSTCLLEAEDDTDFFAEQRIAECSVKYVHNFCGGLTLSTKKEIDNGVVFVDEKNCQTTVFADSFLVYQKLITDLNTIVGVTPTLEKWTVANIHLALQVTRNNADCVITSFFHFINQCATANYISEKDMQCVDEYLNDNKCEFAEEDADNWTLPELIKRYGLYGIESKIEKIHPGADVSLWIKSMREQLSIESQGFHFIDTNYDAHIQEASISVCPQNFNSINSAFAETAIPGVDVDLVAFHFPINATTTFTPSNASEPEQVLDLDPMFEEEECYETCSQWFEFSKKHFEKVKAGTIQGPHLKARCYAIKGYEIFFIESGKSIELSYEEQKDKTTEAGDQCFDASWKEPQSCSSHLTEWRMTVACCTSYAEYYAKNVPTPAPYVHNPYNYNLMEDVVQQPYFNSAEEARAYYAQQQHAAYVQQHYVPPVDVRKVDPADLLFEKKVASTSRAGALASVDGRSFDKPEYLIAELDAGVASLDKQCDKWEEDLEDHPEYFEHNYGKYCEKVRHHAAALEEYLKTEEPVAADGEIVLLGEEEYYNAYANYSTWVHPKNQTIDFKLKHYSYYLGDDVAAVKVCDTLQIDLDFTAIIPLVSGKCYPQACVLSQLANCMEQPEAEYTYAPPAPLPAYQGPNGNHFYSDPYVSQPQSNGYPSYYYPGGQA